MSVWHFNCYDCDIEMNDCMSDYATCQSCGNHYCYGCLPEFDKNDFRDENGEQTGELETKFYDFIYENCTYCQKLKRDRKRARERRKKEMEKKSFEAFLLGKLKITKRKAMALFKEQKA